MTTPPYSLMHPALEVRDTGRYGLGVFAKETIPRETTLFVCGGPILTLADEDNLSPECADMPIEISEWFSMGPRHPEEIPLMPQHYVNHSCEPNAGWKGQLFIAAMREIDTGEEICFDYAMVMHSNPESGSFWTMKCHCGSPLCRSQVAENDWARSDLQSRYDGWFAWHLQTKIDTGRANLRVSPSIWVRAEPDPPEDGRRSGMHWMDSRAISADSQRGGRGCFATEPIPAGAVVFAFGGRIMKLREEVGDFGIQISEEHILGPFPSEESDADFVNHSCDPNLGFLGQVFLIALRDIIPGEEMCFDYAMCLGGDIPHSMSCRCGAPNCRGVVTNEDWKLPELQVRYAGHFQWYLEQQIKAERSK